MLRGRSCKPGCTEPLNCWSLPSFGPSCSESSPDTKFRRYFTEREAQAYVAFLERFATLCPDVETPPRCSPDPGDDYLLALARFHSADFLVSGDPDLCQLENTEPPVLTARALLDRLP